MFRRVISSVLTNISTINSVRMTSNIAEGTKLEKTINQVTLLGRVGAEPQKRGSQDHPVVIFSIATHSNYKYLNGDFMQRTDWHKVCVFKPNLRESVLNFLKKGQRVLITGKISYSEYKDEEGQTKPATAVIAEDVIFFQM